MVFTKEGVDCGLSETGIEQCLAASKHAKQLNIKTLWISPMRRALQTAYWIFKDHPNFEKMRFKVHPLLREKMRVGGDMPTLHVLDMIDREFQPGFKGRLEIDWMEEEMGKL